MAGKQLARAPRARTQQQLDCVNTSACAKGVENGEKGEEENSMRGSRDKVPGRASRQGTKVKGQRVGVTQLLAPKLRWMAGKMWLCPRGDRCAQWYGGTLRQIASLHASFKQALGHPQPRVHRRRQIGALGQAFAQVPATPQLFTSLSTKIRVTIPRQAVLWRFPRRVQFINGWLAGPGVGLRLPPTSQTQLYRGPTS